MVFQNHKNRSFRGVSKESVLGQVLFSLYINNAPASLPTSFSFSVYADNLAIWSSSHSVPTAVEAKEEALIRLERCCATAASVFIQPRLSFISFCTASYGLFAPHALWQLSVSTTAGTGPGELVGFWGSMVFRRAPNPSKGIG